MAANSGVRRILFIDDRFIESASGFERIFHQAQRHGEEPVITADKPWEAGAAFVDSGLVIYDEKEKLFRAWYQGGPCYGPGDNSCMCYATSTDGITWEKPSLGLVEFQGSKENNIVLMAEGLMHDPGPIIDYKDGDPQRRFKAFWWGAKKDSSQESGWLEGHCVGFSPDGFVWSEHPDNPVWQTDAEVAVPFGLERRDGKLVAYCSADGYGMRVVARTVSDDFVNWELPPKIVFKMGPDDVPGTEYGGMCGVDYNGTLIGILWIIRNQTRMTSEEWQAIIERNIKQGFMGPPITMNATGPRTMLSEIVASTDGVNWQRINRNNMLIPFGPEGSWDECMSLAGRPIVANDKIYIYYTGQGRIKKFLELGCNADSCKDWNVDTGLATLRLDAFASLQAGGSEGTLVTKDFELEGNELVINADAVKGSVKVEVLDESGHPISGFVSGQATVITGDQLRAKATWTSKPNLSELKGRRIKLKILVENAHLYSISILIGQGQ